MLNVTYLNVSRPYLLGTISILEQTRRTVRRVEEAMMAGRVELPRAFILVRLLALTQC